jgi:hypothetical protein
MDQRALAYPGNSDASVCNEIVECSWTNAKSVSSVTLWVEDALHFVKQKRWFTHFNLGVPTGPGL